MDNSYADRVVLTEEVILNAWRTPGVDVKKFWTYKELLSQEMRPETYQEWDLLTDKGYQFCYFKDYPEYLSKPIPPCFWYKGTFSLFHDFNAPIYMQGPQMVGIVGSRHIPEELVPRVKEICRDLIKALKGQPVASGLALGCDTIAHEITLDMGFYTVAFLPCSIDKCYPWSNRGLKARIEEKGLCISPWSPFQKDIVNRVRLFERTNFLIECCKRIFVLHANERSGTEYTIRKALQRNKEVVLFTYGKEEHPLQLKYPTLIVRQVD